jgi:hypothetical protein
VTDNPKKLGSKAHRRFAPYFGLPAEFTAADMAAAGGNPSDLKYDVPHGFVEKVS